MSLFASKPEADTGFVQPSSTLPPVSAQQETYFLCFSLRFLTVLVAWLSLPFVLRSQLWALKSIRGELPAPLARFFVKTPATPHAQ